jgi:hypothetical protein
LTVIDDATNIIRFQPPGLKQMAEDLKAISAELALAGERHDHSQLPRCAAGLRRIADRLIREVEGAGLVASTNGTGGFDDF